MISILWYFSDINNSWLFYFSKHVIILLSLYNILFQFIFIQQLLYLLYENIIYFFYLQYLQGKRGIEKPPFDLPDFIKKTGIMEMRASLQEKEDQRTLKAKMRERARPKLGKIDIDYQKLHDAFFKLVICFILTIFEFLSSKLYKWALCQK